MARSASKQTIIKIIESWATEDNSMNTTQELISWINYRNQSVKVNIEKIPLTENNGKWFYDKKEKGIVNENKSFFKIVGIRRTEEDNTILEQPIIIQDEIGILGIVAKIIDGQLYFLMQAKIEPGNVNKIQISPTVQATKSNFMRMHGGRSPAYMNLFLEEDKHEVIVDQIQSEQSSRFLGKRNRNIIILINEEIEVLETHKWMTLGQIKKLMTIDNLVNMDTRTVISCIPYSIYRFNKNELCEINRLFNSKELFRSIFKGEDILGLSKVFHRINSIKMRDKSRTDIIDLFFINNWKMINGEYCSESSEFKIIYCNIDIEGREVKHWQQPLIEAVRQSIFGLIYCVDNGLMKFLVRTKMEIGCFDKVEIGPSIQIVSIDNTEKDCVVSLFINNLSKNINIKSNNLFSEEGGRFYCEQNRNIIMQIKKDDLPELPQDYFWIDYYTLNHLIQFNNILNIQLRNLLSILNI